MKLFFRRVGAYVDYRRRVFAALAAAVAMWGLIHSLGGPPPPMSTVLVATRTIAAGAQVVGADVVERSVPTSLVPDKALTVWPGRPCTNVAGLPRGQILTEFTCLSPLTHTTRPGRTLATVRLNEAAVSELLRPGSTVDILSVSDQGAKVIAEGGLIVSIPAKPATGLGGSTSSEQVLIVDVRPNEARDIAAANGRHKLTATLASG